MLTTKAEEFEFKELLAQYRLSIMREEDDLSKRPKETVWTSKRQEFEAELLRRLGAAVSASPQPRWVKQEDQNGCVVAAIAMITGKSYAEVKAELRPKDLSTDAYTSFDTESYFYEHGYSIVKRWKHVYFAGTDREVWPIQPFAPVHYVQVVSGPSGKAHAVVMLTNGDVLDAWTDSKPKKLSDYYQVNEIMGVFFAPAPAQEPPKEKKKLSKREQEHADVMEEVRLNAIQYE